MPSPAPSQLHTSRQANLHQSYSNTDTTLGSQSSCIEPCANPGSPPQAAVAESNVAAAEGGVGAVAAAGAGVEVAQVCSPVGQQAPSHLPYPTHGYAPTYGHDDACHDQFRLLLLTSGVFCRVRMWARYWVVSMIWMPDSWHAA